MSLPTSACLSVLNLSTTPDSGQYVFNTSHAFGTLGAAAAASFPSVSASRFLFFVWYLGESRFGILYLVVILAYIAYFSALCWFRDTLGLLTHRCRPRL